MCLLTLNKKYINHFESLGEKCAYTPGFVVHCATNAAAVAERIAKDEKATVTIILCSIPMQIAHIENCGTSTDTWRTIKEVHRPKGPVRKVTLFIQLLQTRTSENECVQQYIHM